MTDIATQTAHHVALVEEERPARPEHHSAGATPEPAGQMLVITKGIEGLLVKGKPLDMLPPTKAWRRITDELQEAGILAREIPHRSTYNRFRKRYASKYGLR